MKKIFLSVLAVVAALALVSCNSDPEPQKQDTTPSEEPSASPSEEPSAEPSAEPSGDASADPSTEPSAEPAAPVTLCINEVNGTTGYKGVEIYNTGDADVNLEGWILKKNNEVDRPADPDNGIEETKLYWKGTVGTVPAKGFYVIFANKEATELGTAPEGATATGGLSAKKAVKLELIAPDGTVIDTFNRGWDDSAENPEVKLKEYTEGSFARATDGGDVWKVLSPTFGKTNVGADVLDETIQNK